MNFENFVIERIDTISRLLQLAKETPDKCIDISKLDRPMTVTQENRLELPKMEDETRKRLEDLNWPQDLLDAIGSEAEANIYEEANLEPGQINGKDALIRTDIDYTQKDDFDRTNL